MDDLISRLRARAHFEDERVLKYVMRHGLEPVAYTGSESGRILREAADALEAAREDSERLVEALQAERRWWVDRKADAIREQVGGLTRGDPGAIARCDAAIQRIDAAIEQEGRNG